MALGNLQGSSTEGAAISNSMLARHRLKIQQPAGCASAPGTKQEQAARANLQGQEICRVQIGTRTSQGSLQAQTCLL